MVEGCKLSLTRTTTQQISNEAEDAAKRRGGIKEGMTESEFIFERGDSGSRSEMRKAKGQDAL